MIPETKGLSLEEVDELYREGVKPWKSTTWTPKLRPTQSWTDDKGEIHHVQQRKVRRPSARACSLPPLGLSTDSSLAPPSSQAPAVFH